MAQLTQALDLTYMAAVAELTLALNVTCGYSGSNYSNSRFDICVAQLTLA